ncbi:MAG TPA: glycosyltransferase family 2 protein, partial [Bacteroidales bacterium]
EDKSDVEKVRSYIHTINGFAKISITEREKNVGLANNIIDGVTKIVNQYGKVIVLEDDLILSPYFLQFMNDALEVYKDDEKVGHVHACEFFLNDKLPETFLTQFIGSWGWGTWDRAWDYFNPNGSSLLNELKDKHLTKAFDLNNSYGFTKMLRKQIKGLNNSWAIRWNASLFLKNCYALNVGKSLVQNVGFDGSGTNCGDDNYISSNLYMQKINVEKIEPSTENEFARKIIEKYYRKVFSFQAKALRRIKRTLKGDFGA